MSKVKQIIRLRQNGVALQAIAKGVGLSRNTVKKYLRLIEAKGYDPDELLAKEDQQVDLLLADPDPSSRERYQALEALLPGFEKELKRTGVNRWVIWGEYKQLHPDGYSYPHFCRYLRDWQGSQSAVMHFEHQPADKLYLDFAGKKLPWVDPHTGEIHYAQVYVALLGFSQLTYVEAVPSQKTEDFLGATEDAFHFFGGVSAVLIPDNLKSAVTKASKYEADINTAFADFSNHYQTSVLPARSYKPRDKALVENAVRIVYTRVFAPLRDQVFHSLEQLNEAIRALVEAHNDRSFQKQPLSRRQKFEQQERALLRPLPTERYQLKHYKSVTIMKNCHFQLHEDKHYYSVPYRYIGKKVKVIYSQRQVAVYYHKQQIAFHKRDRKHFAYTTLKDHLPSSHQFVSDWNPDKFISWAAGIHPVVKDYILAILQSKVYPEQAYRSCVGILSLDKKVGRQRLIKAVERATQYGAYNYKIIDRILKGGMDRLGEETITQTSLPLHDNIRGADQYK